jgi:hypothetical protein
MSESEQTLTEAAILFVRENGLDIRWRIEPEGKEGDLQACFAYNKYMEDLIRDMVQDAAKFIEKENLHFPVYIANRNGDSRDDCEIGFSYPDDKVLEKKLNMSSKARDIIEFANSLPFNERENYLQGFREAGWGDYL